MIMIIMIMIMVIHGKMEVQEVLFVWFKTPGVMGKFSLSHHTTQLCNLSHLQTSDQE